MPTPTTKLAPRHAFALFSVSQGDVSKLLTILNEDLDEEDLRNVLMECLKEAPGHDDGQKASQPKGLLRFLPQRRRVVASPQEVAQAAKYIVDRFGVPVEAEEEVGLLAIGVS